MKTLPLITLSLACLLLVASCANPINDYTRARYLRIEMKKEAKQAARANVGAAHRHGSSLNVGRSKIAN